MSAGAVGIVLAGGRSSRFGSDKLGEDLGGRPLVMGAVDALLATPEVGRVLVVGPAEPSRPGWLGAVEQRGVELVRDDEPFGGPVAGLGRALRASAMDSVVIVVAGDMPAVGSETLRRLHQALEDDGELVLVHPSSTGRVQPLPFAARTGLLRRAVDRRLATGDRSLRGLFEELDACGTSARSPRRTIDVDPGRIRDVDEPRDLEGLRGTT